MKIFVLLAFLSTAFGVFAQGNRRDTTFLKIEEAEKIFISNNLEVLAAKYGLDAAQALIRQSRLWDNPSIYLEQNIYNNTNKKYFDAGHSGENIAQLQQLFLLAGKRNKRVHLAQSSSRLTEFQMYDLLRTLKFELRSVFYETYFTHVILGTYDRELTALRRNVAIFDTLNTKGIISLKEDVRLKAFLFGLENERLDLLQNLNENQKILQLLLNDSTLGYVRPNIPTNYQDSLLNKPLTLESLQAAALQNRADLKVYQENLNYERMNLEYQRSLAVPDLKLGAMYDKQGNFIRNYTALSLQMDLPAWNRNQGNIAASRYRINQNKATLDLYTQQVKGEVKEVFQRSQNQINLYKSFNNDFDSRFNLLTEGVLRNYQKRNISLLEFIDFYESYKEGVAQINRLKQGIITSMEEINFVTGTDLVK